jgi:hypothetical protein
MVVREPFFTGDRVRNTYNAEAAAQAHTTDDLKI